MKKWGWIIPVFLLACGEASFFEGNEPVQGGEWKAGDNKSFTVSIDDSSKYYDFFIDFRNTESYPYRDIYFFMKYTLPQGGVALDTIHYYLQDQENRWRGNLSGSLVSHHVLVKQRTRFPRKGNYIISLQHGMRDEVLNGITDIGITLKDHVSQP